MSFLHAIGATTPDCVKLLRRADIVPKKSENKFVSKFNEQRILDRRVRCECRSKLYSSGNHYETDARYKRTKKAKKAQAKKRKANKIKRNQKKKEKSHDANAFVVTANEDDADSSEPEPEDLEEEIARYRSAVVKHRRKNLTQRGVNREMHTVVSAPKDDKTKKAEGYVPRIIDFSEEEEE